MDTQISSVEVRHERLAVLVPTYRRPNDLRRCLAALECQTRLPDQVIVVQRNDDALTVEVLFEVRKINVQVVVVSEPGVVHAITAGIAAVQADLLAITDDDAKPREDWLERIEQAFLNDVTVAGVGGRDVIIGQDISELGERHVVGQLRWYGRVIGNHHLGCGSPRDVHVLKGVNTAFRVALLSQVWFDLRLKGQGAQVHFELAIGLDLVKRGWRLVYDPAILVDHFPAPRHGDDPRDTMLPSALSNEVHNETLALLRHMPPAKRLAFAFWSLGCGTRAYPGILCWLVEISRGKHNINRRLLATLNGRWLGLRSWLDERPSRFPRVEKPVGRPAAS